MPITFQGPFLKVFLRLCEDVNTPRSLAAAMLAKHGEIVQLVSLRVDPMHYLQSGDYFRDNVVTEFLRKCDFGDSEHQTRLHAECWSRFEATERLCAVTNQRLSFFIDPFLTNNDNKIFEIVLEIRRKVAWLVGSVPADLSAGFGPGATLTNSARRSTIPDKLGSKPCGTSEALAIYDALFNECAWDRHGTDDPDQRPRQLARGNRFFTVPKTTLSLRGACLSPNVNGFLQKGVGVYLRSRLKKASIYIGEESLSNPLGLPINSFTTADRHRRLAARASVDGSLATIDLSDASNTIAYNCVQALFPEDWFNLLASLREKFVQRPDKRWQYLAMFSAMGNGFTFEVETIIFWAIVRTICPEGEVSVFGDDIICPREKAEEVLAALRWFGFKPNPTKTFTAGPFRESCGGDYFDGESVRAHYVKKPPAAPEDWIALANGICRLADDPTRTHDRWSYLRGAWFTCLDALPRNLRGLRGPKSLGDLVVHDPFVEHVLSYPTVTQLSASAGLFVVPYNDGRSSLQLRVRDGIRYVRAYKPVQYKVPLHVWKKGVQLASALYGVESNGVSPRGSVTGYHVRWVPIP